MYNKRQEGFVMWNGGRQLVWEGVGQLGCNVGGGGMDATSVRSPSVCTPIGDVCTPMVVSLVPALKKWGHVVGSSGGGDESVDFWTRLAFRL